MQPNAVSVQEVLTNALKTILQEEVSIVGAGRTDTGVHASCFYAHFNSSGKLLKDCSLFLFKINSILPKDIAVDNLIPVSEDAHARFDATSRTYQYYIHTKKNPFKNETSYYFPRKLDMELMNKGCKILSACSDFSSFSKLHTDVKTNNCKISEAFWRKKDIDLIFQITADRFLRNMVRAIVGTILELGENKISLDQLYSIIQAKDRSSAGISVPPQGLFLTHIEYPFEIIHGVE